MLKNKKKTESERKDELETSIKMHRSVAIRKTEHIPGLLSQKCLLILQLNSEY